MNLYQITAPHFCAAVVESNDLIFQAAPILSWSVGKPFSTLRDYAKARGWVVAAVEQRYTPEWVEYDGNVYEMYWKERVLTRIVLHEPGEEPRDMAYHELPEPMKGLL